jgi:predicted GTPase
MKMIDTLTGQDSRSGSSLKSVTKDVVAVRVLNHLKYGDNLVLVDTPGFDDVSKSDKVILEMISSWLSKT